MQKIENTHREKVSHIRNGLSSIVTACVHTAHVSHAKRTFVHSFAFSCVFLCDIYYAAFVAKVLRSHKRTQWSKSYNHHLVEISHETQKFDYATYAWALHIRRLMAYAVRKQRQQQQQSTKTNRWIDEQKPTIWWLPSFCLGPIVNFISKQRQNLNKSGKITSKRLLDTTAKRQRYKTIADYMADIFHHIHCKLFVNKPISNRHRPSFNASKHCWTIKTTLHFKCTLTMLGPLGYFVRIVVRKVRYDPSEALNIITLYGYSWNRDIK